MLNYSRGQQLDLLKGIGFAAPRLGGPGAAADRRAQRAGAWAARPGPGGTATASIPGRGRWTTCAAALRALGVAAEPHETPRALATRVRARLGARAEALAALLDALERQRYGRAASDRPDAALTRRFARQQAAAPAQPRVAG